MEFYLNRLKQFREERNLYQAQLAAEVGVLQRQISIWETSTAFPNDESIKKLSDYFGCDPDYLFPKPHVLLKEMKKQYNDEMDLKNQTILHLSQKLEERNKEITIINNRLRSYESVNRKLKNEIIDEKLKEENENFDEEKAFNFNDFK